MLMVVNRRNEGTSLLRAIESRLGQPVAVSWADPTSPFDIAFPKANPTLACLTFDLNVLVVQGGGDSRGGGDAKEPLQAAAASCVRLQNIFKQCVCICIAPSSTYCKARLERAVPPGRCRFLYVDSAREIPHLVGKLARAYVDVDKAAYQRRYFQSEQQALVSQSTAVAVGRRALVFILQAESDGNRDGDGKVEVKGESVCGWNADLLELDRLVEHPSLSLGLLAGMNARAVARLVSPTGKHIAVDIAAFFGAGDDAG